MCVIYLVGLVGVDVVLVGLIEVVFILLVDVVL